MNAENDLLTAVRDSFAGVRLNVPLDATIRHGRKLRARRRVAGLGAAAVVIAGGAALATALLLPGGAAPPATSRPQPAAAGTRPGPARLTAWTVTKGPGDTVTILIRQLRDPAGMQRTLRADGVPAHVAFQGGTLSDTPPLPRRCLNTSLSDQANAHLQGKILGNSFMPEVREGIALVIHANEIPKGIGLNLTVQTSGHGWGWSLGLVRASPECTGS
jgi:hypothetical protein